MDDRLLPRNFRTLASSRTHTEFGTVLGNILEWSEVNATRIASHLKLAPMTLESIILGRQTIVQHALERNEWRRALATFHAATWEKFKDDFEQAAAKLPMRLGVVKKTEKKAERKKPTAPVLPEASTKAVKKTLKNLKKPDSQPKSICESNRQSIGNAPKKVEPHKRLRWRREVGRFVEQVLNNKGDAVEDILSSTTSPLLAASLVWQQIKQGDSQLAPRLFKAAIKEICQIYHLQDRPNPLYDAAQKLLMKSEP